MKLGPANKNNPTTGKLNMSATAKTYRYLQEDEQ
jgi:Tfp pilus assembly protein PilO